MVSLILRILLWMLSGYFLGHGSEAIAYDPATQSFTLFNAITLHLDVLEQLLAGGSLAVGAGTWRVLAKKFGRLT